ncbi:MAG: DUF4136 domain-containing protein [Candidatus Eisenbacteria sp.]|nr:DUF4136 domain-containing protein [Candidatus Eisenbacteria bacterium]
MHGIAHRNPVAGRSAVGRPLAGILATLMVLIMIGSGCSRVAVHTIADPEANFTEYSTFKFLREGGKPLRGATPPRHLRIIRDPAYHAILQEAIGGALIEKGFQPVRGEAKPDLLIGYHTVVQNRRDVVPPIYGVGWRGHVYVARPGHVRHYKEGTLVIDVVDAAGQHLVWRGVGVGAMRDMRPGEALHAAVGEILEDFPPD